MMSEALQRKPSDFVWYEFHTNDAAVAEKFYCAVLGWNAIDAGMPDRSYVLVRVNETAVGGLLQKPASTFAGATKPGWIGYVGVENVDEASGRLQVQGGFIHRGAEDIPNVGRFAVVADPQGALFVLFQPSSKMQQPPSLTPGTPGTAAWHDLIASDWQKDFDFYSSMFGWTKADAMDMGSGGVYQIFATNSRPIGGMMNRMDPNQPPGWLIYFNVEQVAPAIDRVKKEGGRVIHGPSEIPGGLEMAHCLDTQGAIFGIVGPRKQA